MVVPWTAAQLVREDTQSSVGCSLLLGYSARLYGDLGGDRTKVWAHGLAAGGGDRRQWATVPGLDARSLSTVIENVGKHTHLCEIFKRF